MFILIIPVDCVYDIYKAIEAGADIVDCAISPLAMGTSQPPTEPLVATLQGTPYDTGLDMEILNEIAVISNLYVKNI